MTHQNSSLHSAVAAHKLLVQATAGVILERAGRLADDHRRRLLSCLLALQVALKGIEEEAVMGDREPVEDLLLNVS